MQTPSFYVYLFINPTSGGNRAGVYLQIQAENIKFTLDIGIVSVSFVSLHDKNLNKRVDEVKGIQSQSGNVRVIVCGGDGTVMWVVEELVKCGVDLSKCPIGIVPFGTGNDFSRVLGWGGESSGNLGQSLGELRTLIKQWMNADICDFDIWEVNVYTTESGFFRKIIKTRQGFTKDALFVKDQPVRHLSKKLSNYFSLGVDARIGYGFDKKRTQSACCNKCVYFCEGIKKMCLSNPTPVQVLESMEIIDENQLTQLISKEILFHTKPQQNAHIFKSNPVTLLCLNIPSYSGGAGAIWDNCQGKTALKLQQQAMVDKFHSQNFGDGEIEFVSFNTMIGMANERFIHGMAERVTQGKGPFLLRFKQGKNKDNKDIAPYIQIDGEFYQVVKPSHATISHCTSIPNGKIKVLVKKQ